MKEENEALAKKRAQQKRRAARADNRWRRVEKIVWWNKKCGGENCMVKKIVRWRKLYGRESCMLDKFFGGKKLFGGEYSKVEMIAEKLKL